MTTPIRVSAAATIAITMSTAHHCLWVDAAYQESNISMGCAAGIGPRGVGRNAGDPRTRRSGTIALLPASKQNESFSPGNIEPHRRRVEKPIALRASIAPGAEV